MKNKVIKKTLRTIGGMLAVVGIVGATVFGCCAFENGDITYGQAWLRLFIGTLAALAGAAIYEASEQEETDDE